MTSNRTDCVSDSMPEMFDLKETVCERCVDERVKVRPVVEERTVCRNEQCCQAPQKCFFYRVVVPYTTLHIP